MQTSDLDIDPDLAERVREAEVVVFRSRVTDTRTLETRLHARSIQPLLVDMPMGQAGERDRFQRLSSATGRHHLPIVFARGEFIGGEPELAAWLDRRTPAPGLTALRDGLGYAGLLPFVATVSWIALSGAHAAYAETLLLAYGAVILSFVGALHWGWALATPRDADDARRFIWSVVPSLIGWLAFAVPTGFGVLLLAAGFLLARYADGWLYPREERLASFLRLRTNLTGVAVVSLLLAAFIRG